MARGFQRAINKHVVEDLRDFLFVEVGEMVVLAEEAFKNIPLNRPILQCLVDYHCKYWRNCCEDHFAEDREVSELPHKFIIRAMRRFNEMLTEEQTGHTDKIRCYMEHTDEKETTECGKLHMRYDEKKDFGFFGSTLR